VGAPRFFAACRVLFGSFLGLAAKRLKVFANTFDGIATAEYQEHDERCCSCGEKSFHKDWLFFLLALRLRS